MQAFTDNCQPALLTVAEVAKRLKVSPSAVYALCAQERLAHHRVGLGRGTIRVSEADLQAFIESCRVDRHALLDDLA